MNRDNYPLMKPVVISEFSENADEVEPFPTTIVIATIVSVAAVGVGLMVYFKRHQRSKNLKKALERNGFFIRFQ